MRGLEQLSAQEILAQAVERHHPRLVLACSFQKEESVLIDMLMELEPDEARGLWKFNPLADWSEQDVWRYLHERELPYNPLHDRDYASIGCAPCTLPGSGREGRWAGEEKTECGLHV